MKKFYSSFLLIGIFLCGGPVHAQVSDIPVRFTAGDFITGNNIQKQSFNRESLQASAFSSDYYLLVQFAQIPSLQTQRNLKTAGVNLETFIPGNAYLATVSSTFNFSQANQFNIISINNIPSFYKIDKAFADYKEPSNKEDRLLMAVNYFSSVDKSIVIKELVKAGALVENTKFTEANIVFVQVNTNLINTIAALPFVSYLSLQTLSDKLLNYKSTGKHGFSNLLSPAGKNLSGKGIVVGIGDNSEIVTQHIDFTNRVINRVPFPFSFHGIHVSGIVAGAGLLDQRHRGMAPRATIVSQYLSDIITTAPTYVADYNMVATNNSYYSGQPGCVGNSAYDVLSNYTDLQMGGHKNLLHVFSAGNDGGLTCTPYPQRYATIKSGYQTAKNVLTVGAITDSNYVAATFSSRGPVNDGRLKPEIIATGVRVYSTRHFFSYEQSSGTSMSGPIVAGAATILNEQYRKSNFGAVPPAALIKAVLCNTAEDLGNPGPDYTYGFGNLHARRAADAIENNRFYISSAASSSNTIAIPAGARRLKVMLYWADTAAAPFAATTLVNDLDLTVVDPSVISHFPLILDPSPANVNNNALPGVDRVNNIEQVVIENPAAGNYNLNVSTFALPYGGSQEYIVTYQIDMNGVTVEYPFGDEKLVPGETEVIRWTAYGDELNTISLEFNDGASWNLIDNNVAATAQSYNWIVPATVSNNCQVRVTRNSSVFSDQSDRNFTVLGSPVVTATVPCEGYAQLDWPAITGATSYDIWSLQGDSMAVIGNTTGLTYLIPGLNPAFSYWFGVSAKNGAVDGRRSVSRLVTPVTGVCSLGIFDNNFKAVSIDVPVTGRQFTSSTLSASEPIRFTIKNLDNVSTSGSYNLSYRVNGGPVITESSSIVVAALGTTQYMFASTADFSVPGSYTIQAWVKRPGDIQELDDTVTTTIKHLANAVVTLPALEGFETALAKDYLVNTTGLDGLDRVDFKASTARGRARTFVNTGFALNGSRAITLDQFPYNVVATTDSMLITYNLSGYSSGQQLRLDFYYKNHGQENSPNNKVWIRGSDTRPWVFAYDLIANQAALGGYKHAIINVNDVLDTVLPAQPISSSFQIRFTQEGKTSANIPYPVIDQDDGYTFDDVGLKEASNDISIYRVLSPSISGCGATGNQPVTLEIKNYSSSTFTNVPVYYNFNGGGTIMETIASLPPGITAHSFTAAVNLVVDTDYSFNFWTNEPTDNYNSNDSVLNYNFYTSPVISSYPYLQGFEADAGSWYTKGQNSSWQWGTPAGTLINKAANGTRAWVTNLTGNYNTNEHSYLYSPCFNLSGLTTPMLSFSHIYQIEDGTPADYNWVEYSINGGITWSRLGTHSQSGSTNWYNDPTGKHQWRPSLQTWHVASINIPVTGTNVRFRFVLTSDQSYNREGVGIDDIHIYDKAAIYSGAAITGITQPVSGSNWIHFNSGATRVVSVNANGNNLGSTTVAVYPVTGPARVQNNQYYLNRNIVIRPTTTPATDVTVRFYFTDAEAKNLLAATGCAGCTVTRDPYVLGVTKYSGSAAQENGTLADNSNCCYLYILPANTEIIPYDNGYYAEFLVNSFSEFWLNNGGAGGVSPLPVTLLSFEAVKQTNKVLLQWVSENEINVDRYIIERSTDGINYAAIAHVFAFNNNHNSYSYTDLQPLTGLNYYRLKIQDKDASYRYSPVRKVNFNNSGDDISVYPNPVTGSKIYIASSGKATEAILYGATGNIIRSYRLSGRSNILDVSGIAKGTYQLKVISENAVYTGKIIIY